MRPTCPVVHPIAGYYKVPAVDRLVTSVQDMRTNLIENIELQRVGFRNLGSPFYDWLGQELEAKTLEAGPVWSALGAFRRRAV
jgi:hypothetical protein